MEEVALSSQKRTIVCFKKQPIFNMYAPYKSFAHFRLNVAQGIQINILRIGYSNHLPF